MNPKAMLNDLKKKSISKQQKASKSRVRIGMATCGVSAGADKVYTAFIDALSEAGIKNVDVVSTGCVGRCDLEPMAEVSAAGSAPALYIKLDEEKVKIIVKEHLAGGRIVEEYL